MGQQQERQETDEKSWVGALCIVLGASLAAFIGAMLGFPSFVEQAHQRGIPMPGPLIWQMGSTNIWPSIFAAVGALIGYGLYTLVRRRGARRHPPQDR